MDINKIIQEAELAKERQRQAWADERTAQATRGKAAISEAMGENWATFAQYISGEGIVRAYPDRPDSCLASVWYEVNAGEKELAPFRIVWKRAGVGENNEGVCQFETDNRRYKMAELADLLLDRREAWRQAQAAVKEKTLRTYSKLLDGFNSEKAGTECEADAAYLRLAELAPDRQREWQRLRQAWQAWHDKQQAEAAEQAKLEGLANEYQAFYRQYLLSYAATVKVNAARLAEKQKELDVEYTIWELGYALIAEEGGERMVETRTAIALGEAIGENGYWLVWEEGQVRNAFYYHLISKKRLTVRPSMPGFGKRLETDCGYLSVWPLFQERLVTWKLEAVPLPQPPSPPEDLCRWLIEQAQDRARRDLPDEDLEFVQF